MICNSTPLIFLAKINQLKLLKNLFTTIIIPEDVKTEILKQDKPGYLTINTAIQQGWVKIKNPKDNKNLHLGNGENAAINLAKEKKHTLIIDDALAIKVAQEFDINIIRTTTLIFLALKKKLINKKQAITLINKLIENGYYISPKYYSKILTKLTS